MNEFQMYDPLMGDPLFRMGMGILEGATPQATPPNAIANMMKGAQGAVDYRNNELNRMLQRQRYKMDLEQREREQERWLYEKKDLERKNKAMEAFWANRDGSGIVSPAVAPNGLPSLGPGMIPPAPGEMSGSPGELDEPTQKMLGHYRNYLNILDYQEAATTDPAELGNIAKNRIAVQEAMRDLTQKGIGHDRYSFRAFTSENNRPMYEDKWSGKMMVRGTDGKLTPYNSETHGHPYTASQGHDPSGMRLNPSQFNDLEMGYYAGVDSLQRIDNLYKMVELGEGGIDNLMLNWRAKIKQLSGKDLNIPEMANLMSRSEVGKLVGEMRIDLFGGGPLTDQEREFATDVILGKLTSDKELMKQRLRQIFETKMRSTERQGRQLYRQYQLQPGGSQWQPENLTDYDVYNVKPFFDIELDTQDADAIVDGT